MKQPVSNAAHRLSSVRRDLFAVSLGCFVLMSAGYMAVAILTYEDDRAIRMCPARPTEAREVTPPAAAAHAVPEGGSATDLWCGEDPAPTPADLPPRRPPP